ncbi:condensation domain-containing protein [Streptomyces sp. URMC 123]|uniref:condensation domain-containing protein n=1 Tax=Streptomyces sp. URMC 123 TaxID=3423403 RepID=UPI003F1CF05C
MESAPPGEPLLAPGQRRLWLLDHLSPAAGTAYNMSALTRLRGPLDPTALQAAWDDVADRHERLRAPPSPLRAASRARVTTTRPALAVTDLSAALSRTDVPQQRQFMARVQARDRL